MPQHTKAPAPRIPLLYVFSIILITFALNGCTSDQMYEIINPQGNAGRTSTQAPTSQTTPVRAPVVDHSSYDKNSQRTDDSTSVKVGLLLPLSGSHSALGQAMLDSAQLALFNIAQNNFELVPMDTSATPEGARRGAQNLADEKVDIILGPVFAGSVRAVKPVANNAGINVIAFSTDTSLAGGNTFLMGFTPFDQIRRVSKYAKSRGVDSIGIISTQDDYGQLVTNAFRKTASQNAINIPNSVVLPAETLSVDTPIKDFVAKSGGMGGVLISTGGRRAVDISRSLSLAGASNDNVRRIGTGLFDDPGLYNSQSIAGAWFAAPDPQLRQDFENSFTSAYGYRAPRLATLAYDATALTAVLSKRSLKKNGRTDFSRSAITNVSGFAGVDGIFRFNRGGLAERGLAVLETTGNGVRVIDPAPKSF